MYLRVAREIDFIILVLGEKRDYFFRSTFRLADILMGVDVYEQLA